MALKSKGFFLNLEEGTSTDQAIQMAPVRDLPVEDSEEEILAPIPAISKPADGSSTVETAKPAQAVKTPSAPVTASAPAPSAPVASSGSLTTAQAIAAALAEAEAARPVVTLSTFAPEMLRPGRDLRSQPRRPGRNLKGFKDMASELFKS
ncbi:MAG: translation initiation factor 2 [Synechococcus sp. MED-G68]|nr:MAG: translation initiation factor 2 [Synechococcus sp. MED-G68]